MPVQPFSPSSIPPDHLAVLVCLLEENHSILVEEYSRSLSSGLFSNRLEFHPRHASKIVAIEADAFAGYISAGFKGAVEHGAQLADAGLGKQVVINFMDINRDFLWNHFRASRAILDMGAYYRSQVTRGYYEAHEARVLKEQDEFRRAFEIALRKSLSEVQAAREQAQKATERVYRAVILAQEEERRFIARELHDQAGQALIGLRMSLENLLNDSSSDLKKKRARLLNAISIAESTLSDIRSIVYSLRPPVLDLLGIDAALKQLCFDFGEQTGLLIEYSGANLVGVSDEVAINLYRFAQEGLTNIVKHASARRAWVSLHAVGEQVQVNVEDDGQGFDPDTVRPGIGLVGMRERARLLNGSLEICSGGGSHTCLSFSVPMA